jgi:hypothetical protein
MVGALLMRGMLVGLLAGLLAFAFAKAFGEPEVDKAIAFETRMDQAKGEAPEPELVSRTVQSSLGLLTGVVVYGTALGGPTAWSSPTPPGGSGGSGRAASPRSWRSPASSPSSWCRAGNIRPIRPRSATPRPSATAPDCIS